MNYGFMIQNLHMSTIILTMFLLLTLNDGFYLIELFLGTKMIYNTDALGSLSWLIYRINLNPVKNGYDKKSDSTMLDSRN